MSLSRVHVFGGPPALHIRHATLVSDALIARPVVTVHALHCSAEKSRSCPNPTTHTTTLSILRNQSFSLVTPLLVAVHYTVQVMARLGFYEASSGTSSGQNE